MASQCLILLTNDDGAGSPGLEALRDSLSGLGSVYVVAPTEERSACSHSLSIHHPVRIRQIDQKTFTVSGSPADCVVLALRKILPEPPALVVSGINDGPNLGDDVVYSGTVAGAREAAMWGVPAMAVSLVSRKRPEFAKAGAFARRLAEELDWSAFPAGSFLNVNVPSTGDFSYRLTRQGSKRVFSAIEEKKDPRGRTYYWIGRDLSELNVDADTDYRAIQDGVISVTPLMKDQTDYRSLRDWRERLQNGHQEAAAQGRKERQGK